MPNRNIDVYEVTFQCPQCGQETIETTTDMFNTLYQRGCGGCGSTILRVMRSKRIFGDPTPNPEDFFELMPEDTEE